MMLVSSATGAVKIGGDLNHILLESHVGVVIAQSRKQLPTCDGWSMAPGHSKSVVRSLTVVHTTGLPIDVVVHRRTDVASQVGHERTAISRDTAGQAALVPVPVSA